MSNKSNYSNDFPPSKWINLGSNLLSTDPKLAQRFISNGIKDLPREAIGYFNLGIGLHQQKKIKSAIKAYRKCLSLDGGKEVEISASNNLAQDLLLIGQWREGLKLYEKRFERKPGNYPRFKSLFGEAHQGQFKLDQKIILMNEQGFGDTLQFSRLALLLQNKGHNITLLCQPQLVRLLKEGADLKNVVDTIDGNLELNNKVSWLPLLSLLNELEINPENIPYQDSYIKINDDLIIEWRAKLKRKANKHLIGIHWQGSPGHEKSLYSRGRSMNFEDLLFLKKLKGFEFVSLQKGHGSEQLKLEDSLPFIAGQDLVSKSYDFLETAAVLANCDLLITADSGIVHLAGGMGVPTLLALRWIPEWRWGLNSNKTPWYNSVQLIRQKADGDWESIKDTICEKIANYEFRK